MEFLREAFKGGNRFLVGVALVAALGSFLFGYDTGIIGGASLHQGGPEGEPVRPAGDCRLDPDRRDTNWTFNFAVSFTFLSLVSALGKPAFWLYAGFGILAILFFWRFVPETKDRTLEEIEQELGSDADEARRRATAPSAARRSAPDDLTGSRPAS